MAELASILNPEFISQLRLIPDIKLNHSFSSSSCDSAAFAEKQLSKKFLVEVTDDDDDDDGAIITLCHLDDASTNLSFSFSGNNGGSLIPPTTKDPHPLVEKTGYRQQGKASKRSGKGKKSLEKGSKKENNTSKDTKDDATELPNKDNADSSTQHNKGTNGNDGAESSKVNSNNGKYGILIHGYTLDINDGNIYVEDKPRYIQSSCTTLHRCANEFDGWLSIALTLHNHSLNLNENFDYDDEIAMNPANCFHGCLTFFGRIEPDHFYHFYWLEHNWDDIKLLVTDIFVVRLFVPPNKDRSSS